MSDQCTRCGQDLDEATVVWLELNQKTNTYQKEGTVPPEVSQGGFPFGPDCALTVLNAGGKLQRIMSAAR